MRQTPTTQVINQLRSSAQRILSAADKADEAIDVYGNWNGLDKTELAQMTDAVIVALNALIGEAALIEDDIEQLLRFRRQWHEGKERTP